jgi:UDP-GlcNAc:undecaprenyl-phosphate GlcNAc-1-phosphate transferase
MLITLTLAAIVIAFAAIALCHVCGLLDHPDQRKRHRSPAPLAGGIAIFSTFLYATLVLHLEPYSNAMLVPLTGLFLLGVVDDRLPLGPRRRLALHFLGGLFIATWGGITILDVGNLLGIGPVPLLYLAAPLTALAFAGLANAYNMIDGIDGLAAVAGGLPLGTLLLLGYAAGHPMTPTLSAMLLPLAVFLCFNLGPNSRAMPRVFLGDAGSVTIGCLVCASLVYFSQGPGALIRPVTALWLVALPLLDMVVTLVLRLRRGLNPLAADRSHLHYRLLDIGLGTGETLLLLTLYAGLCAVIGLGLEAFPEYLSLLLYCLLFLGHLSFALRSERIGNRFRKSSQPQLESAPGDTV